MSESSFAEYSGFCAKISSNDSGTFLPFPIISATVSKAGRSAYILSFLPSKSNLSYAMIFLNTFLHCRTISDG